MTDPRAPGPFCPDCGVSLPWAGPAPHAWDEYARRVQGGNSVIPDPVPRCTHCRTRTDDLYRSEWGWLCGACKNMQVEHDAHVAATAGEAT